MFFPIMLASPFVSLVTFMFGEPSKKREHSGSSPMLLKKRCEQNFITFGWLVLLAARLLIIHNLLFSSCLDRWSPGSVHSASLTLQLTQLYWLRLASLPTSGCTPLVGFSTSWMSSCLRTKARMTVMAPPPLLLTIIRCVQLERFWVSKLHLRGWPTWLPPWMCWLNIYICFCTHATKVLENVPEK